MRDIKLTSDEQLSVHPAFPIVSSTAEFLSDTNFTEKNGDTSAINAIDLSMRRFIAGSSRRS